METKDTGKQDPSERASHWISNCLAPVFGNLMKDLKGDGYLASRFRRTDQGMTPTFSKAANRFEYTINCMARSTPTPNRPEGHMDLDCYYRANYVEGSVQFRDIEAKYDIEDAGEMEIAEHFRKTFRPWLSRRW